MIQALETTVKNGNIGAELALIIDILEKNSSEKKINLEETLKQEDTKQEDKSKDIEEEIESLDEEIDETDTKINIKYSFDEEQFIMEQFYNNEEVKYEQSLYKQTRFSLFESEEEYAPEEREFYDTEAESLTTEEAEGAMIEIQYAAVVGTSNDVNYEKKRKFDMWIKFNSAMFKVFEITYALTRDVDYKPLA